jgi:predicted enzyme related to lactoylglutathione lyase
VKRAVLASGGYARAGIAPLPASVKQPGWLPYVLVNDVAATLAKVRAAGGRVLVEPRAELLDDNLAVIADPSGGVIGIVNWSPTNVAGPAQ